MSAVQKSKPPLSAYAQALVQAGKLTPGVAAIISRLPDLASQQVAVRNMRHRLPELAEEVVQWLEAVRRQDQYAEDYYIEGRSIHIRRPYCFMSESWEDVQREIDYGLRRVLMGLVCPICGKGMDGTGGHEDCAGLEVRRRYHRDWQGLGEKASESDQVRLQSATKELKRWEEAFQNGRWPGGRLWNSLPDH
jgi:hypothetical protein